QHPSGRPFAMESMAPTIYVKDLNLTTDFYKQLGFEIITTVPEKGDPIFALMRCGGITFVRRAK
ncbi:MAG: hypothetical protein Q8932_20670, partial [Bacteroidota bacterium]|nr:hypothetical protein [Bacteroidota bacterium]